MARLRLILFSTSLLGLCWYGMQAIHELGHVLGALLTGGQVTGLVLHPLKLSATFVFPNPDPHFVVWAGPIVGVAAPCLLAWATPSSWGPTRMVFLFAAGFCLIANGAYIGCGGIWKMGDGAVMIANGSNPVSLAIYGVVSVLSGIWIWHRLGSIADLWRKPDRLSKSLAITVTIVFIVTMIVWSIAISIGIGWPLASTDESVARMVAPGGRVVELYETLKR